MRDSLALRLFLILGILIPARSFIGLLHVHIKRDASKIFAAATGQPSKESLYLARTILLQHTRNEQCKEISTLRTRIDVLEQSLCSLITVVDFQQQSLREQNLARQRMKLKYNSRLKLLENFVQVMRKGSSKPVHYVLLNQIARLFAIFEETVPLTVLAKLTYSFFRTCINIMTLLSYKIGFVSQKVHAQRHNWSPNSMLLLQAVNLQQKNVEIDKNDSFDFEYKLPLKVRSKYSDTDIVS